MKRRKSGKNVVREMRLKRAFSLKRAEVGRTLLTPQEVRDVTANVDERAARARAILMGDDK